MSLVPLSIQPGPPVPAGGISQPIAYIEGLQTPPILYLIRHGEKPDDDNKHGLSQAGKIRAQALIDVFNPAGLENPYDIRYMFAMQPKPSGAEERPLKTIEPLSESLGITIDHSISRGSEQDLAAKIVSHITTGLVGNILVCWEHHNLTNILTALQLNNAPLYPSEFDVCWTLAPQPVAGEGSTWTWNQIQWSSERTPADLPAADHGEKWKGKRDAPENLITQSTSTPQYTWNPTANQ